jgi:lantibiotic modifying enzyme
LEQSRERPDLMKGMELPATPKAALMMGEAGILFALWRVAPAHEVADALHAHVRANVDNGAVEVMWGSPGSMIAARAMLESTGDERWRDAWHESADALLARRDADGLWKKRLYGGESRGLGPPHGVVGNVLALRPLLDAERRAQLERDTNAALARTAVVEEGLANWPNWADGALEGSDGEIRVQWCAGAPGIVTSAADYLDEELLLAGAELPWRAGPPGLEKGPCICHGTAGNGYAFLAAFARTGDERWLDRARHFAVHALEQVERLRAARGRGRYSLWTGDLGVALYAADCLEGRTGYPVLSYSA